MLPKHHAMTSGLAVLAYTVLRWPEPVTFITWLLVGLLVGVFIDLDHLPLIALKPENRAAVREGIRRPFHTLLHVSEFRDRIAFRELPVWRMASHIGLALMAVVVCYTFIPIVLEPVAVALAVHLVVDALHSGMEARRQRASRED